MFILYSMAGEQGGWRRGEGGKEFRESYLFYELWSGAVRIPGSHHLPIQESPHVQMGRVASGSEVSI